MGFKDLGLKNFQSFLDRMSEEDITIKVGIFSEAGTKAESEMTVAQIGAYQEFGTYNKEGNPVVPERSFLRSTVSEQEKALTEKTKKNAAKQIKKNQQVDTKTLAEVVGLFLVNKVKEKIRAGIAPKLKRRSGTPLIDTGQLINSIDFQIDEGADEAN